MKPHYENKQYRYPGVTPFSTEQSHIFFGRKEETNRLYKLLYKEKLVVLHSKSGLGKSSLINAGLIPQLQDQANYKPIIIRFGAWSKNNSDSPIEITKRVLNKVEKESFLSLLIPDDNSIWLHAKNNQILYDEKTIIIFDQFEELFSYPEEDINSFKQELSELLNTSIPLRFRRGLENLSDDDISEEDEELLYEDLNSRILFSIRSDKLHLLNRINDFLPNILRNCYELNALNIQDAISAITQPAQMEGAFHSPKFTYTQEALDKLINFLTTKSDKRVEGILIQMLCEHYEKKYVIENGELSLGVGQIGDPKHVIFNYYEDKVHSLPSDKQILSSTLIEDGLVSEGEDGMRLSLHEAFILKEFNVSKQLLNVLVDKRLLRSEPFLRGGYTYELSHDRLVPAVVKARKKRRNKEALEQKEQEALVLRKQAQIQEKEKIKVQKQLRTVRGLLVLVVAGLLLAFYGFYSANKQTKIANINLEIAKQNEEIAELKSTEAERERDLADALRMQSDSMLMQIQKQQITILKEKQNVLDALSLAQRKEQLRKMEEKQRILEQRKNINSQIEKIRTLIKVEDFEEAKELLQTALKVSPNHPVLLNIKDQLKKLTQ